MQNRQNPNQPANWRYLPSSLQGLFGINTPSATASINTPPPLSAAAATTVDVTSASFSAALIAPPPAVDTSLETAVSSSTVLIDAEQSNKPPIAGLQLDHALHAQNPAASAFVFTENNLPGDVANIVSMHLSRQFLLKHQSQLAKTCQYFHTLFQPGLNRLAEAKAYELLQYVIHGDQDAAEDILKVNPGILLWTASINTEKDAYTNRPEIMENATAFQAALRLGDVEMWQMMEKYFKKIANGDIEKSKQFYAEFPDGKPIKQQPYDLSCLVDIISKSDDATVRAQLAQLGGVENESALCQAINIFRFDFTQCSLNEKHFNPEHLINALTVYDEQFDRWSWNQRNLFCRQVFGYMQRYMPACYAQAFAQGIYYITEEREALRRTFDYRVGGDHILPLDSNPAYRLGYEMFCGLWQAALARDCGRVLKKFCQTKTAALGELKQRVQNPESGLESSQCVIS